MSGRPMINQEEHGSVLVLELAHGKVNVLDRAFLELLDARLKEAARSGHEALVLTGAGAVFSAGLDLRAMDQGGAEEIGRIVDAFDEALTTLATFPRPVIAAANGHAIAGGCILLCACDRRLVAEGELRIGVPEMQVGLPFPVLAFELLRAALNPQHFDEVIHGAALHPASRALEFGFAHELVAPAKLRERAIESAQKMARIPPKCFELTRKQLRAPMWERIEACRQTLLPEIKAYWCSATARASLHEYVKSTLR